MRRQPRRFRLFADGDEPLLRFVARRSGVPEDLAKAAIERGGAFLRGRRERDPFAEVHKGDRVEIGLRPREAPGLSRDRILHLDDLVVAIDKPAGVAAQEDREGGAALPALCSDLLGALGERTTQVLLVHRLDRGTTGVTLLARTRRAQAALLEEFRERRARKEYRALVRGAPRADESTIDVSVESKPALTRIRVLERHDGASLVAAFPETGRTHQVRVHLRELGHPLLGDKPYGGPMFFTKEDGARLDFSRPLLHALSLEVRHPRAGELRVAAPLPPDFAAALAWIRG